VIQLISAAVGNQGHTILRVIGDVIMHMNAQDANVHEGMAALAMQSGEAIAAGATFEPRSDPAEWMWQRQFHRLANTTDQDFQVMHEVLDVRAKRKLTSQNGLYFVFERGTVSNQGTSVGIHVRVLLALP